METENRFALLRDHELILIRFALHTLDNIAGYYDEAPMLNFLHITLLSELREELVRRRSKGPIANLPRGEVKRMSHGDLYEKAKTTIDELYSDASVSLETIRSSLEALITHTISAVHALDVDRAALETRGSKDAQE